jgi:hypothetical protein
MSTINRWIAQCNAFWRTHSRAREILLAAAFIVLTVILCLAMWKMYGERFSWGAWGDDSPGYQFLAARYVQDLPLIWEDELGKKALNFFGDYQKATWILPTHHEFIHPNGTIASKYPVGASLLLAAGAWVAGNPLGMYPVNPLLAGIVVVLTGILALAMFWKQDAWKWLIAVGAMVCVAFSPIFISHAISQPMREIPSMALLLAALIVFVPTVRWLARQQRVDWKGGVGLLTSGLLFGLACTVRETSIMMLPAYVFFGVATVLPPGKSIWKEARQRMQMLLLTSALFAFSALIGLLPLIQNSMTISQQNEPFKARDTGQIVLLSNINHIQTISPKHLIESTGRYRPADGSLQHYWNVMNEFTKIPFFVWFAIAAVVMSLWKGWPREERIATVALALWALGTLTIFSLWINPYSRYILPMLPVMSILSVYGMVMIADRVLKPRVGVMLSGLWIIGCVMILATVADNEWTMQKRLRGAGIIEQRSITRQDAETLDAMAVHVKQTRQSSEPINEQNTIVLFSGMWQHGLSEVFWAQTGVRGSRFPTETNPAAAAEYPISDEQAAAFVRELQLSGVEVYLWTSYDTLPTATSMLQEFSATPIYQHDYSFLPSATLYRLQ